VAGFATTSAEQGADAGQQLVKGEGFDQIVVCADVEASHAVGHGVFGGEHQDRNITPVAGPQPPANLQPVEPRHHHVEDHQIGGTVPRLDQSALAVESDVDCVAFVGQPPADEIHDLAFVVNDQNPLGHLSLRPVEQPGWRCPGAHYSSKMLKRETPAKTLCEKEAQSVGQAPRFAAGSARDLSESPL
jgi:hypothetical protein